VALVAAVAIVTKKRNSAARLLLHPRKLLSKTAEVGASVLAQYRRPVKNQDGDWFSQHHHFGRLRLREVSPRVRRVDAVCDWPGSGLEETL
jgi:hypothetical protein